MKHAINFLFAALALALSVGAYAEPNGRHSVTYEGTTLIVDGVRFERRPEIYQCGYDVCTPNNTRAGYVAGFIVLGFDGDKEREVDVTLAKYGLETLSQNSGVVMYLRKVAVPNFFEEQWADALKSEPSFRVDMLLRAYPASSNP